MPDALIAERPSRRAESAAAAPWEPGSFALRDAWFPVAHVPELNHGPIVRFVHSKPFHIWRGEDGVCAASHGPMVPEVRRTGFVEAYPVAERYGHIWVWYGAADNADPALLPDIPFLPRHRSQPRYSWGVNYFHCTYELVLENILDLTHVDFIHGSYAGSAESAEEDSIRFESTSETVTMIRTIRKRPTSSYQRDVLGVTARYQDQEAYTHVFIRSGICFLHTHYSDAPSIPLMQSNTPESRTLTRANYCFGIQQTTNRAYAQAWPRTAAVIAAQDESVLNPQNPRYLGQAARGDCSTRFDAAGLHYRKRALALIERQKAGDFSYQADIADGSDIAEILKVRRPD